MAGLVMSPTVEEVDKVVRRWQSGRRWRWQSGQKWLACGQKRDHCKKDVARGHGSIGCTTCKKCMVDNVHGVCVSKFLNDMNSHTKLQFAKVSNMKKKKQRAKVWKPKKFESPATPSVSTPRYCLSTSGTSSEAGQPEDETQNDNDAVLDDNIFFNPFGTPLTELIESSSRSFDPSNMHTFYQMYSSEINGQNLIQFNKCSYSTMSNENPSSINIKQHYGTHNIVSYFTFHNNDLPIFIVIPILKGNLDLGTGGGVYRKNVVSVSRRVCFRYTALRAGKLLRRFIS
uniref:Uncharacterized protein n=1 Tax=Tanacetum cinerariifolium TaxID=118510 RepID=A0A6L2KY35_TANCI|nr:hypothetical protein [Tanacetum cinerariifolium]